MLHLLVSGTSLLSVKLNLSARGIKSQDSSLDLQCRGSAGGGVSSC